MNNYLRRYEESQTDLDAIPQEALDCITTACVYVGKALAEMTEAVRALVADMPELAKWAGRYLYPRLMDPEAVKWALDTRPEWVKIYRRTKSGRIRKKYRDRIMREDINR